MNINDTTVLTISDLENIEATLCMKLKVWRWRKVLAYLETHPEHGDEFFYSELRDSLTKLKEIE